MRFNQKALEDLMERRRLDYKGLSRDIREETGHRISWTSLRNWAEGERLGAVTLGQINTLEDYAAKTENEDLKFYTS